jgi:cytoplasmic tRNA 2-thiolation protein 1
VYKGHAVCRDCFFECFELEVHETIVRGKLFRAHQTVAVASSGGKDSTVLGHVLHKLNQKYDYKLDLRLLSIDEGISGYRDDSLEAVKRNQTELQLPLTILNYKQLYGWTMDEVVAQVGLKSNCTFCGVLRRQALERGAVQLVCDVIATGHNADDLAETILMNLLRGDVARLQRSVHAMTGSTDHPTESGTACAPEGCCGKGTCESADSSKAAIKAIPRCKPFKYTYEKEIVMYAYFKKLDYFSTECVYAPNSYRGHARAFLKDLEAIRPSAIIDIIHSGESFRVREGLPLPSQGTCERCGHISSQNICKACVMLEGLNRGQPKLGIGKSSRVDLIRSTTTTTAGKQSVCRKEACDCELLHRTSSKQVRKQQQRQRLEQLESELNRIHVSTQL